VPRFRLVAGQAGLIATFEAADHAAAEKRGRELSRHYVRPALRYESRAHFRVEQDNGDGWVLVVAWIPASAGH
jgi:hypothetical protein